LLRDFDYCALVQSRLLRYVAVVLLRSTNRKLTESEHVAGLFSGDVLLSESGRW